MKRKEIKHMVKRELAEWEQEQYAAGFDQGMQAGAIQAYENVLRMLDNDSASD